VFFQANVSLKGIWPLFIVPRPFVLTHQGVYSRLDESFDWPGRLKIFVTRFAKNIAASYSIAEHIASPATVIPNPYQDKVFLHYPEIKRAKELVFLGRLVSDKGVDLLLEATANLHLRGVKPKLTVIGSGPEEGHLREQAAKLGLADDIDFTGAKSGDNLARMLNLHQIMVTPSLCKEGFGIVALEGIACGCVVVGSEGGGLKDAIGPCGITFPNGNLDALTQALYELLTNPERVAELRQHAAAHLARHTREVVAKAYLKVIEEAVNS
jgi:glycosyltransferase involved in cell wall biosynthesis